MCTNPRLIKNVNYHSKVAKGFKKDTVSQYIPVPCGHCAECRANRSFGILQRCELEAVSGYPFKLMLSYSNKTIPKHVCSDGTVIKYVDFKDLTDMFKRIRRNNSFGRPFRYLAVSERGGKKGRPHIHLLLFLQKMPEDHSYTLLNLERCVHDVVLAEWKRSVSPMIWSEKKQKLIPDTFHTEFVPLCNYVEYLIGGKVFGTYGCQAVYPADDGTIYGALHYITKYFNKRDVYTERLQQGLRLNLSSDEYDEVWSKVKTRYISSLNFGFGCYEDYNARSVSRQERMDMLSRLESFSLLRSSIQRSLDCCDSPKFYQLADGRAIPLSRYFYHIDNLYTQDVYERFKDKSNKYGDYVQVEERTCQEMDQKEVSSSRRLDRAFIQDDITDLFNF